MTSILDEKPKPVPVVTDTISPEIFADAAVGAFLNNGNVHITLVARRCDHSVQPSPLTDVIVGRLVMPLSTTKKMIQFLGDCLETIKTQNTVTAEVSRTLQ